MRRTGVCADCVLPAPWVIAVLLVSVAAPGLVAAQTPAGGDEQQKGIALIARAELLQSLVVEDSGPFHLSADVKLFGLVSGDRAGTYFLGASGPGQWLEMVRFPGYTESNGVFEGFRWRKRNVIDKPYRFHELAQLLNPARHLKLPASAEIKKLSQGVVRGSKAFCIQASPTKDLWQKEMAGRVAMNQVGIKDDTEVTLCFDADAGVLLSASYQTDMPRFEYEGQVTLGNKVFPRVLRCFEGKELVVEATVRDLAKESAQDPAGFAPPAGADKWPACADPEPPQLVEKKRPSERQLASSKVRRQFGTVYCLAEIGTDGTVHDFTWVQARYGSLAGTVRDAVAGWRYRPATCNGVPVPVTIYIAYTFPP